MQATFHTARRFLEEICETLYEETEESKDAKLSELEQQDRKALIKLCTHIALDFGHEVGEKVDRAE